MGILCRLTQDLADIRLKMPSDQVTSLQTLYLELQSAKCWNYNENIIKFVSNNHESNIIVLTILPSIQRATILLCWTLIGRVSLIGHVSYSLADTHCQQCAQADE